MNNSVCNTMKHCADLLDLCGRHDDAEKLRDAAHRTVVLRLEAARVCAAIESGMAVDRARLDLQAALDDMRGGK